MGDAGIDIISNLTSQLKTAWTPLLLIAAAIGFVMFGVGLIRMVQKQGQGGSFGAIYDSAMTVFAGLLLLNLSVFLKIMTASVLASQMADDPLSFQANTGNSATATMVTFAVVVVAIVGLIGFIRGIILLTHANEDPRAVWSAITHLIGGTIAMNIPSFMLMIGHSAGGSVLSMVQMVFN